MNRSLKRLTYSFDVRELLARIHVIHISRSFTSQSDGLIPTARRRSYTAKEKRDSRRHTPSSNELSSTLLRIRETLGDPRSELDKIEHHPETLLEASRRIARERKDERSSLSSSASSVHRGGNTALQSSSGEKTGPSLFDVFTVPEPEPPKDPNEFDDDVFKAFSESLERDVLSEPKFLRNHTRRPVSLEIADPVIAWLRQKKNVVPYHLPTFEGAISKGVDEKGDYDTVSTEHSNLASELQSQQRRFRVKLGFDAQQFKLAHAALSRLCRQFAKDAVGLPASILWEKMKEAGVMDEESIRTLLHVASTFSITKRRGPSNYGFLVSILDVVDSDVVSEPGATEVDIVEEVAIFHDILFQPTDQSLTARLKLLVVQGNAKEANLVIAKYSEKLRLRACTPVLRLQLEQKDPGSALGLFQRMLEMPLVFVEPDTFFHLLAGLAELGCFRMSANSIPGAKDLGYTVNSGPDLFDEIVSKMPKEGMYEIEDHLANRLISATTTDIKVSGRTNGKLVEVNPEEGDKQVDGDSLVASTVSIDHSSGLCPLTGIKLRLITLSDDERKKLRESLLELARVSQLEHEQRLKITHRNPKVKRLKANEQLELFLQHLDERSGDPYTVVVDGANVGFHLQNFERGGFSFYQVKLVVDSLVRMGENPLVVLPQKYAKQHSFRLPLGFRVSESKGSQVLTKEERKIRSELTSAGRIYCVNYGHLDDFYWISASIADQTRSRNGRRLEVSTENSEGRWSGARPLVISNDQIRDHRLSIMEPMLYRRWYSNHIVNYSFAWDVKDETRDDATSFETADAFSREIQCNRMPDQSVVWHFPIADSEDGWLCVRLPRN